MTTRSGRARLSINWLRGHHAILVMAMSGLSLAFLAGLTARHLGFADVALGRAFGAFGDLMENAPAYYFGKPVQHLRPLRFPATGLVTAEIERIEPGVTFVTGLFGDQLGARLYDADGTLLHQWPVDFFKVAPDTMAFPFDALIHGDALYPNGDIVVNLDGRGLLRVDACGQIVWQNREQSHHSIFVDEAGFIWTPVAAVAYTEPRLAAGRFHFDKVGKFDPANGHKILEIDLVRTLLDASAEGLMWTNKPDLSDTMHLNDVEILSSTMADRFPDFTAGDIMLSSRHFNQIWVLDSATHALKWWQTGPMFGQHDPDFQPDGSITLFDNRPLGEPAAENHYLGNMGGSRILRIDPRTRAFETLYQSTTGNAFYSPYRGKHQMLPNGNILITETDAGRVFEVTSGGEVVWSLVNAYDEDEVGWLMGATRYPPEFAAIGRIHCHSDVDR